MKLSLQSIKGDSVTDGWESVVNSICNDFAVFLASPIMTSKPRKITSVLEHPCAEQCASNQLTVKMDMPALEDPYRKVAEFNSVRRLAMSQNIGEKLKTLSLDTRRIVSNSYSFWTKRRGGAVTYFSLFALWLITFIYGPKEGIIAGIIFGFMKMGITYITGESMSFEPGALLLEYPVACCAFALGAIASS